MTEAAEDKAARLSESRHWKLQMDYPIVYVKKSWALAYVEECWHLYKILAGGRTHHIKAYDVKKQGETKPPYLWAKRSIDGVQDMRMYKPWEEKKIHGPPGTESRKVLVPQNLSNRKKS